jgi:hypothetical protein
MIEVDEVKSRTVTIVNRHWIGTPDQRPKRFGADWRSMAAPIHSSD